MKLLYYAESASLAINNKSLFSEKILGWEHGPVVKEIWEKYSDNPYEIPVDDETYESIKKIRDEDISLLTSVYDVFGEYSAWGLRNKTHSEKPWREATLEGTKLNKEINRETMKQTFEEIYL